MIGQRTSDGLKALILSRKRLGGPIEQPYDLRIRIAQERTQGRSFRSIANDLNLEGVPTARRGKSHSSTVVRFVRSVALDQELAAR